MDPFESEEVSPRRTGLVKCNVCAKEYFDEELVLDTVTNEFCCKDYPDCSGSGLDIVIADGRRKIEAAEWKSKLDFNPYPPPDVPILVRCVTCLGIYMSTEIRSVKGVWVCKFAPSCIGDGFGLNIFPVDHSIFRLVRNHGAYRKRSR